MKTTIKLMTGTALLLAAPALGCQNGDLGELGWGDPNGGAGPNGPGAVDPASVSQSPTATCESIATKWVGFAAEDLNKTRDDAVAGIDRTRFKPYSALTGEYPRVTGVQAPQLLANSSTTFGQAPNRWYTEPQASAVNLYTAFRIAFESCLTYTATDTKYAAAPTDAAAAPECSAMARRFWSRAATADEVKTCVQVATVDSTKETNARRRWAYTCASVLSAAGFLTY